jgi:hypothetical protein
MSDYVILQGSQTSQTHVVPWRGSPRAGQPLTWPPPPGAGYWTLMMWGPPRAAFLTPPPQSVLGHWLPPPLWRVPPAGQVMSWAPTSVAQAMPYGMPPWIPQHPPPSSAMV